MKAQMGLLLLFYLMKTADVNNNNLQKSLFEKLVQNPVNLIDAADKAFFIINELPKQPSIKKEITETFSAASPTILKPLIARNRSVA